MININISITSVGVQRHDAFIPTLGSSPAYMSVSLPTCLYIYLSGSLRHFFAIIL